jgi:hypothetical protein
MERSLDVVDEIICVFYDFWLLTAPSDGVLSPSFNPVLPWICPDLSSYLIQKDFFSKIKRSDSHLGSFLNDYPRYLQYPRELHSIRRPEDYYLRLYLHPPHAEPQSLHLALLSLYIHT